MQLKKLQNNIIIPSYPHLKSTSFIFDQLSCPFIFELYALCHHRAVTSDSLKPDLYYQSCPVSKKVLIKQLFVGRNLNVHFFQYKLKFLTQICILKPKISNMVLTISYLYSQFTILLLVIGMLQPKSTIKSYWLCWLL